MGLLLPASDPTEGSGTMGNGTQDVEQYLLRLILEKGLLNATDDEIRGFLNTSLTGNASPDFNRTHVLPGQQQPSQPGVSPYGDPSHQFCQFDFREQYKWWHYRAAVCIATLGAITNLLTIATLKRRTMATPTNRLLLGLAVTDLLVVVEYIPYAASTMLGGDRLFQAKEHALYVLVHAHLSHVCHTIAIWLTVTLAVWRWVAVCRPHTAATTCTMDNARRFLLAVYLACPVLAIPSFLLYTVHELPDTTLMPPGHYKLYKVDFSYLALAHDELLKKINFLVYSVVVKLVPCVLITFLMPAIIRGMWMAKNRRKRLLEARKPALPSAAVSVTTTATAVTAAASANNHTNPSDCHTTTTANTTALEMSKRRFSKSACGSKLGIRSFSFANGTDSKSQHKKNEGATERTTSMLLVVMLLFLLTEAPQGMLTGLSLVYGHDFFSDCYMELGDLMDLLALINSSINFALYCVMSNQFRETFISLICDCKKKVPRPPVKPTPMTTTTTTI